MFTYSQELDTHWQIDALVYDLHGLKEQEIRAAEGMTISGPANSAPRRFDAGARSLLRLSPDRANALAEERGVRGNQDADLVYCYPS
jgi:hypothetical protein